MKFFLKEKQTSDYAW